MFFKDIEKKSIDKIKINSLKRKLVLKNISIYIDNQKNNHIKAFLINKSIDILRNISTQSNDGENNAYLIVNFSNIKELLDHKFYDIVVVSIDFKVLFIVAEHSKKEILELEKNNFPTNVWLMPKGTINYYKIKKGTLISIKPIFIKKNR